MSLTVERPRPIVTDAPTEARQKGDIAIASDRFWCDVPGHESMEGVLHVR